MLDVGGEERRDNRGINCSYGSAIASRKASYLQIKP